MRLARMISAPIETKTTAPLRSFAITVIACWIVLGAAAWPLARSRQVPVEIAVPVALAFLTEISFYLLPGFERLREWIAAHVSPVRIAAAIAVTAPLPYLIFAIPTGHFALFPFLILAVLTIAVAFWYVPAIQNRELSILRDTAFLLILAAAILSGIFKWIYPAPIAKLPMETLGHLTLVRCSVMSILLIRGTDNMAFGFIPTLREIRIGSMWAAVCTAVAFPIGLALGEVHFTSHSWHPLQMVFQLLGIFWFVALSEEFFFRALLQQWLTSWTGNAALALVAASCLYGACHLKFPNWQFAILAAILGLFCGIAFLQTRSMRASMITHTLVAGVFRLLLS